jgi:hypothetical protein
MRFVIIYHMFSILPTVAAMNTWPGASAHICGGDRENMIDFQRVSPGIQGMTEFAGVRKKMTQFIEIRVGKGAHA